MVSLNRQSGFATQATRSRKTKSSFIKKKVIKVNDKISYDQQQKARLH